MTRTLDFSPDMDSQLQVLAAQRGASVEAVLFEAAKQLTQSSGRDFLALMDDAEPRIAAGVLRPITSDDISQAIADARP